MSEWVNKMITQGPGVFRVSFQPTPFPLKAPRVLGSTYYDIIKTTLRHLLWGFGSSMLPGRGSISEGWSEGDQFKPSYGWNTAPRDCALIELNTTKHPQSLFLSLHPVANVCGIACFYQAWNLPPRNQSRPTRTQKLKSLPLQAFTLHITRRIQRMQTNKMTWCRAQQLFHGLSHVWRPLEQVAMQRISGLLEKRFYSSYWGIWTFGYLLLLGMFGSGHQ